MDRPEGLPEPGLYADVPFRDYLAWPAASNSGLGIILKRTPSHYKEDREGRGKPQTDAKLIGKATHALVLEPSMFGENYRAAGICNFVTEENKPCQSQGKFLLYDGRSACGTHVKQVKPSKVMRDVQVLTLKQAKVVNGGSEAVQRHQSANELLTSEGPTEVAIVWRDPVTGVWCKGRLDKLSLEFSSIVDYKTAEDASDEPFQRSVYKYGYHRQGAFYLRATDSLGLGINEYVLIAQEKSPPYAVATYGYPRTGGTMQAGDDYIEPLLRIYARCGESGEWPGYSERVEEGHLPHYAWAQMDEELERLNEEARKS